MKNSNAFLNLRKNHRNKNFKTKVEQREVEKRRRGDRLVKFEINEELVIENKLFKIPKWKLYSWGLTQYELK